MMLPPTVIIAIGEGKLLPRPSFRFAPVTNKKRNLNLIERFLKRLYYIGTVFAEENRSHEYPSNYTAYPDGSIVFYPKHLPVATLF